MTLQDFKTLMQQNGFTPVPQWTRKGKYASFEKGKLATCYVVEGRASLWAKGGAVLLPFCSDFQALEQSLQQIK